MGIKILMTVCMLPVLPIIYFVMKSEGTFRKNIVLGTTLPNEAQRDDDVLAIIRSFKRMLNQVGLGLLLMIIPAFFLEHSSIIIAYFLNWLVVVILLPYIPYVKHHNQLKRLKAASGWKTSKDQVRVVDLDAAKATYKKLSIQWLILPAFISLLPVINTIINLEDQLIAPLVVYVTNLLVNIIVIIIYGIIFKQRTEMIDANTDLSISLTRMRKYHWSKFWLMMTWFTSLFSLALWPFNSSQAILIISVIYSTLVALIAITTELNVRNVQHKLSRGSGKDFYVDEDDLWIKGIFYFNPNDHHLFVNARVGFNTSVNLAKSAGKAFVLIGLISMLSLPILSFWIIAEEFTPISIELTDNKLVGRHLSEEFSISIDQLQDIQLIKSLPNKYKISGTGFKTLSKGSFNVEGYGQCELLLNPQDDLFISFVYQGEQYIISRGDQAKTQELYKLLIH